MKQSPGAASPVQMAAFMRASATSLGSSALSDELVFEEGDDQETQGPPQTLQDAASNVIRAANCQSHPLASLQHGTLYLMNIRSVREFLAERWSGIASKIHEAVEHMIAEALAPADRFVRVASDRYVLAFSLEGDPHVTVEKISQQVRQKIFGEASGLAVEICPLGHNPLPALLESHRGGDEPSLVTPASGYAFAPIWDGQHKVLSTYTHQPVKVLPSGRIIFGHDLLPRGATDVERAQFDAQVLHDLVCVATQMQAQRQAVLTCAIIDYGALASGKSREIIAAACGRIPQGLAHTMMVRIANMPGHVPTKTFAERIAAVRPYFRAVLLQIPTLEGDLGRYAYQGLHGLHYQLLESDPSHTQECERLALAVGRAAKLRLRLGVSGIAGTAVAETLARLGVAYLSGPFLGISIEASARMIPCTLDELTRAQGL